MDLKELFEMQKKLDAHIVKEKGLEGQDRLPQKILALQVELGELANEWRGFKFWSEDQEPRTKHVCSLCECSGEISAYFNNELDDGYIDVTCPMCDGYDSDKNPLLEEYVDCLHFALSIGCDIGYEDIDKSNMEEYFEYSEEVSIVEQFITLNWLVGSIFENKIHYEQTLFELIDLGKKLDFTWEQVVQAYKEKNKVNHERQENGY